MSGASVQAAHDALLALKPESAANHSCPLCTADNTVSSAKEEASVADANVYTEAQHFALVESAVERETSSLTSEKAALEGQVATLESEKAALADELTGAQTRIDVLEAEKANAEAAAEAARTELADFKAELARKAEVAAKKDERVSRVKAANGNLDDTFFTPERVTRWAEMADESFEALVADMTEAAAAVKPAEVSGASETTDTTEQARETAAFSGGSTTTVIEGSALATFLGTRRGPKI